MTAPIDELAARAAAAVHEAAQQRAEGLTIDRLHRRRRARHRRRGATAMAVVLALVVVAAVLFRPATERTTLLERPDASDVPLLPPPVEGSEAPARDTAWHDDVLIVDDGLEGLTIVDPAAGLAFHRTAEGQRRGDQPHRLIRSGDRLVVGWGGISSTTLTGADPVDLGDATIALPAHEGGLVWLVTYASGRIDGGEQRVQLVDVTTGEVEADGTLPAGTRVLAGVPAGLALNGADGIEVWSADTGDVTRTLESAPATFVGGASLEHLASCGGDCDVLHLTRMADGTAVTVDAPPGLVFDAGGARFAPRGRVLAVPMRPPAPIEHDDVASLALVEVATGELRAVQPPEGASTDRVVWSVDGRTVYGLPQTGAGGDAVLVRVDAASGTPTAVHLPSGSFHAAVTAERHEILELFDLPADVPACEGLGAEPCRYADPLVDLPAPTAAATGPAALSTDATRDPDRDPGWHELPAAPLRPAFGAAAAWTGTEFVVWGGYAGAGTPDEEAVAQAAAYDPATDRWRELPDAPIPGAYDGEALWTGTEVWVVGGFGGETGRDPMLGAAAYDPATDAWRNLPDLPGPMAAAAWLDTAAALIASDGTAWTLDSDGEAWVEDTASRIDPPFAAASGDGALLVVADGRRRTYTSVDSGIVGGDRRDDLLGLSATAQDQRIGVAAMAVEDGDPRIPTVSTVVVGQTATTVETLGVGLSWRMEDPPDASFISDMHVVDERRVVAVEASTGHVELIDTAAGNWDPLAPPPHDPGHSVATAAGGGMVLSWGGGSPTNQPHDDGALLVVEPARARTWPPDRAPQAVESIASTPMVPGVPDDLDPDPGLVPPVIAPPGVWSVRTAADGVPVLVQRRNDDLGEAIPLPGPPLTTLALGDLVWAAGPATGGVRLVLATWQEVVPHVATLTIPFEPSPDRPVRIAPVPGGAWLSGLVDGDDPVIVRVDQATGEVTHQIASAGEVFRASLLGEVLLLEDATLTRASAHDLSPTHPGTPLPGSLDTVSHIWDDRGDTVVVGDGNTGGTVVWDLAGGQIRRSQLAEPVVAADANLEFDGIALATADGAIEVIDLTDPGAGQLLTADHQSPLRHVRLNAGPRVDVTYADGQTGSHWVTAD